MALTLLIRNNRPYNWSARIIKKYTRFLFALQFPHNHFSDNARRNAQWKFTRMLRIVRHTFGILSLHKGSNWPPYTVSIGGLLYLLYRPPTNLETPSTVDNHL